MNVALSIVFTGLCALVVDAPAERAATEVLLVDARGVGEVNGVVFPRHSPTLVASLDGLANAETSQPSRVVTAWPAPGLAPSGSGREPSLALSPTVGQIGIWDLTGSEVRIRVQGQDGAGVELYRPPAEQSSWPEPPVDVADPRAWRDLRFVADMARIAGDGRIDPTLVAPVDASSASLPRGVGARFHLDAGRLEGAPPSHLVHRGDVYEFAVPGSAPRHRQALTDTIAWTLDARTDVVVVEIAPAAGGPVKRLVLAPSAAPHRLFVANLPAGSGPHDAHQGMSADEIGFLHFGAYYALLKNEPGDRPVPRLASGAERKGVGVGRPAFCGTALFSRN